MNWYSSRNLERTRTDQLEDRTGIRRTSKSHCHHQRRDQFKWDVYQERERQCGQSYMLLHQ